MMHKKDLAKAMRWAERFHFGQVDKAGLPYIAHICHVVGAVRTLEQKVVAALHDIVEDTDCSIDSIRMEFSGSTAEAVEAITKVKGESYNEYLRRVAENPLALEVKLADLKHNSDLSRLPEPTEKDRQRVWRYMEARRFLLGVKEARSELCHVSGSSSP